VDKKLSQQDDFVNIPLVVDLDETLIRTDLLFESFLMLIAVSPVRAIYALFKVLSGRSELKSYIADHIDIRADLLPYDEAVIDCINVAKNSGKDVYLVSASDDRYVKAVADHLGLFTNAYGSSREYNLSGLNKAKKLVTLFGKGGFDYIGDNKKDIPIWEEAAQAFFAGPNVGSLLKEVSGGKVVSDNRPCLLSYIKCLRVHQWLKNLLIFVPFFLDHTFSGYVFVVAFFAFIAFSLCASSVYIINDLLDLNNDRTHSRKKNRPFASGEIPIIYGMIVAPFLLIVSAVIGFCVSSQFLLLMMLYFILTLSYSVFLKRIPLVDVVLLAVLYGLRILAGGVATYHSVSSWFLAFAIFLFLFLAMIKRLVEVGDSIRNNSTLASGRGFAREDLPLLSSLSCTAGYMSILIFSLYITNPVTLEIYQTPELLWGVCMLLLFWVNRLLLVAHRGGMDDDPMIYALTDRISLVVGFFVLVLFFSAVYF